MSIEAQFDLFRDQGYLVATNLIGRCSVKS